MEEGSPDQDGGGGPAAAATVRLVHLTDTHLYADPAGELLGVPTERALETVLAAARRRERRPDLIAATGDLVHDGSMEGYERLAARLAGLGAPVRAVPGNHDDRARLCLAPPPVACCGEATLGGWLLVFLDSSVPGEDWGHLDDAELGRLDGALAGHEGPAGIFLHHPPLPVGSAWIDRIGLRDPQRLFGLLDRHPGKVRFIAFGHVHQRFEGMHRGVLCLATPSTCVQFAPGAREFAADPTRLPGYRWIELTPDGQLRTAVVRVRVRCAATA